MSAEKINSIKEEAKKIMATYGVDFKLSFDLKGRVAGQARFGTDVREIRINTLFLKNNFDEILSQTLYHEVAHLISFERYGIRNGGGHGRGWKRVMREMGKRPERLHNYDTSNIYEKKLYCKCRTHPVSTRMYNNIAKRNEKRKCIHCKTHVQLDKYEN